MVTMMMMMMKMMMMMMMLGCLVTTHSRGAYDAAFRNHSRPRPHNSPRPRVGFGASAAMEKVALLENFTLVGSREPRLINGRTVEPVASVLQQLHC